MIIFQHFLMWNIIVVCNCPQFNFKYLFKTNCDHDNISSLSSITYLVFFFQVHHYCTVGKETLFIFTSRKPLSRNVRHHLPILTFGQKKIGRKKIVANGCNFIALKQEKEK